MATGHQNQVGNLGQVDGKDLLIYSLCEQLAEVQGELAESRRQLAESKKGHQQTARSFGDEKKERRRLEQRLQEETGHRLSQQIIATPAQNMALQNRRPFILVLIDADADQYMFQKKFLDNNEDGGKEAADEMLARIKDYAKTLELDVDNLDIMIQAYANFEGLGKACKRKIRMNDDADLSLFASGFTRDHELVKFVDVGPGKEEADEKIRQSLDSCIVWEHCKHAVIGVCHDAGYAPYLRKYSGDDSTRDRITLLESGPIDFRIKALGFQRKLRFDTVFAKVLRLAAAASSDRLPPIQRNKAGKRVDKPLNVDTDDVKAVEEENLCSGYYLRGRCDDRGCSKTHKPTELGLLDKYFEALWFLARSQPCKKTKRGKVCADRLCLRRHGKA